MATSRGSAQSDYVLTSLYNQGKGFSASDTKEIDRENAADRRPESHHSRPASLGSEASHRRRGVRCSSERSVVVRRGNKVAIEGKEEKVLTM